MEFSVDLAKRLNAATAKVQFVADAPRMEMKERFGLLTVAAGLRQSGLFVHLETRRPSATSNHSDQSRDVSFANQINTASPRALR